MNAMHLFTLVGIPVRATVGFLILLVWQSYNLSGLGAPAVVGWVLALTLSFLVHEFGHALVAARHKLAPQIQLHMWGGLCFHQRARKDSHDVAIVAAGPLLQIAVGAIVWGVAALVDWRLVPRSMFTYSYGFAPMFVSWFVWFSVIWGALNLLVPVWPLDGGQLFRMLMLRLVKPARRAERVVHIVGIALGAGICIASVTIWNLPFLAVMAAMWAIENVRYFQMGSPVEVRGRSELVDRLLLEAAKCAQQGEWHEARRLAFQARDERTVTDDQLAKCFALIVVASAELRDWTEALSWTNRAPRTPAVFVARIRALCGLGKIDQARAELEAADAPRIEPGVRSLVESWLAGSARP